MSEANYIMPVRAIKRIVKDELSNFYNYILNDGNLRYSSEATLTLEKLESCNDYESLDDFIDEWYQISLQEWINSL